MTSHEKLTAPLFEPQNIGIIGLGSLGTPVAKNLLADGHTVTGYRRHNLEDFAAFGGTAATSSAAVAEVCSLILLCLPDAEALHEVVSGPRGLCESIKPGTIVVDLGTCPVSDKEQARVALAECGAELIDAPVSGTPEMVEKRDAIVMASGPKNTVDKSRPGIEGVGILRFVGDFGNGSKLKCIANTLVAINTAASAEALALAEAVGLDIPTTIDVISSGAGNSVMFSIRAPWMYKRDFVRSRGSVETLRKDISMILRLAEDNSSTMPMLTAASGLYNTAADEGRSKHDIATLFEVIQESENV